MTSHNYGELRNRNVEKLYSFRVMFLLSGVSPGAMLQSQRIRRLLLLILTVLIMCFLYLLQNGFLIQQQALDESLKLEIQNPHLARYCLEDPGMTASSEGALDLCGRPGCLPRTSVNSSTQEGDNPALLQSDIFSRHEDDGKARNIEMNQSAFFLETSGASSLNTRQACAVESLARHNPNLPINVLMMGGTGPEGKYFDNTNATFSRLLLSHYSNVRLVKVDLAAYLLGTQLEHWYFCTSWNYGPYAVSHLSDALRFLTLAKYGGYYLDLDVISLKPLTAYRNFAAIEDHTIVGIGVIHVDRNHPVILEAVEEFRTTYQRNLWAHNGPALLTRILRRRCHQEDLTLMTCDQCQGFCPLSKRSFYPIHSENWMEYFRPDGVRWPPKAWDDGRQVIGAHVWNKLSYGQPVHKDSDQLYAHLARTHCPLTYEAAAQVF